MQMFKGATAGSLWAFARFGADSTSSLRGGSFDFFVGCDEFTSSAERFSPEA